MKQSYLTGRVYIAYYYNQTGLGFKHVSIERKRFDYSLHSSECSWLIPTLEAFEEASK